MQKVFDASFEFSVLHWIPFSIRKLFDKLKADRFNIDRIGFKRYNYDAESVLKRKTTVDLYEYCEL